MSWYNIYDNAKAFADELRKCGRWAPNPPTTLKLPDGRQPSAICPTCFTDNRTCLERGCIPVQPTHLRARHKTSGRVGSIRKFERRYSCDGALVTFPGDPERWVPLRCVELLEAA